MSDFDSAARIGTRGKVPIPIRERVQRRYTITSDGCWTWDSPDSSTGYGRIIIGSRADGTRTRVWAHRLSYEMHVGPIPDGYEIDHLCRNRRCINPEHLEAVTPTENRQRAGGITHCRFGHLLTRLPNGRGRPRRVCHICERNEPK